MALQSLILPIVSIFRSMGLNSARNALTAITKDFKGFSKQVGMAAGSFAAFSALTTARQFTVEAVEATQRFERNVLALNQIFEDAAPSLRAFTKEVESYGLSQQQAAQASVFLGSVLKQYGFDTREANAETQNLVKLAQDLATTFGYDVQEALLAITALFRGEYDPIEKFGVAMKQNEINAVRAARGLGHLTGAAEMQADAQIRLELLFERAADSMGAFERATNTLYGSQQRLNAVMSNLQVAFGEPLQTPLADLNNIFADLAEQYGPEVVEIGEALGNSISTVAPIVERFGGVLFELISPLEQIIELGNFLVYVTGSLFSPVFEAARQTLGVFNGVVELASSAVGRLAYEMGLTVEQGEDFNDFLKSIGIDFERENTLERFARRFGELAENLKTENQKIQDAYEGTSDAGLINAAAQSKMAMAVRRANEELERQNNALAASLEYLNYLESIGASVGRTTFEPLDRSQGTDYVGDFFRGIEDAVKKESARIRLLALGASEGLVDAILGSQGWEEIFKRVIRDGEAGLQRLQAEFNKTAAGIAEVTEAAKALEEAQRKALEAAEDLIQKNVERLQAIADKAVQAYNKAKDAADEFRRWTMNNLTNLQILPDIEVELGRFESSIISSIENMQSGLQSAFRSGLIFESDFNDLQRWVATESQALSEIARRRDELANRASLSESLISEYQQALTSSMKLTNLLGRLKDETETITVTEVSEGVVTLGASLKELGFTVTRSYEETIEKVQDKTAGLLQGFKDMAQKSRDFAENLRKLRDMGLDPMLFNQLVEAGVEAGGETAQALVDGGSATIGEINTLFDEINQLGAELGYEVSQTMYDSGKDMTYGLLEGIKSQQEQLLETARMMAQAFSDEFKSRLDIAVEAPVVQARQTMEKAQEAVQEAQKANVAAVQTLQDIITKAGIALGGKLSTAFRAGIEEKKGAAEALLTDVLSGQVQDITGIASGITSAEFKAAALRTGSEKVTNYYIQVEANTRAQGAKAGEAVVDSLTKYVQSSGNSDISALLST